MKPLFDKQRVYQNILDREMKISLLFVFQNENLNQKWAYQECVEIFAMWAKPTQDKDQPGPEGLFSMTNEDENQSKLSTEYPRKTNCIEFGT